MSEKGPAMRERRGVGPESARWRKRLMTPQPSVEPAARTGPESITLVIPHIPPTLNEWSRMHWSKRAHHARMWRDIVNAYAPRKPRPYFARPVNVSLLFHSKRSRDGDGMTKFILDGCVGVLFPDDSPKWVNELRVRSSVGKPSTTIVVEVAHA